jgi:hypothetical protein
MPRSAVVFTERVVIVDKWKRDRYQESAIVLVLESTTYVLGSPLERGGRHMHEVGAEGFSNTKEGGRQCADVEAVEEVGGREKSSAEERLGILIFTDAVDVDVDVDRRRRKSRSTYIF